MPRAARALLLTGAPGVGKTTVVRAVLAALAGWRLAGFYTDEIRVEGERRGFRGVTLDGWEVDIARAGARSPHRVGGYGVDVAAIDALAARALAPDPAVDLYLVDEIGKMECRSPRFVVAVRALLDSGHPVLATVARRGGGFIAGVKERVDVEVCEVTRANRDAMPATVLEWLGARTPRPISPVRSGRPAAPDGPASGRRGSPTSRSARSGDTR
jgi:nucleoside-triphosphatase